MPNYRIHAVIVVEDAGRNEALSESRTNFKYQLSQPCNFYKRGKDYEYFVRIENVRVPVSFYNINSNYNTFGWTGSATGVVTFDITQGNYTIDELITEVQVQMNLLDTNTYALTYDEITQKVNIASTGTENLATLVGDGWQTLGFGDLTETITGASNVDGTNVAYTNTLRHLKLLVNNLTSNNVYSNGVETDKSTKLQRVSLTFPVTETRNEFLFFDNHDGHFIKLPNMSSITELDVKLLDPYDNEVNLNGVPWGFECSIYKYKKPRY